MAVRFLKVYTNSESVGHGRCVLPNRASTYGAIALQVKLIAATVLQICGEKQAP